MKIGQAARETGLTVTIRYYEKIRLIDADRAENGYRDFGERQITQLRLVAQTRHLGFRLDACRRLRDLNADPERVSWDVQALAVRNLDAVRFKIRQLRTLEEQLETMIYQCRANDDPDYAILDGLTDHPIRSRVLRAA